MEAFRTLCPSLGPLIERHREGEEGYRKAEKVVENVPEGCHGYWVAKKVPVELLQSPLFIKFFLKILIIVKPEHQLLVSL